jgi:hypothetical protein
MGSLTRKNNQVEEIETHDMEVFEQARDVETESRQKCLGACGI